MDKQQWHELPKQWLEEKRHPTSDEIIKYLKSLDWVCWAEHGNAIKILNEVSIFVIDAQCEISRRSGYEDGFDNG